NPVRGRQRRGIAKNSVLGNKGMEQMLWDAACDIRGEKDAPKFKDYLLPLLFIKRLSDVFDDEAQRLAETYGDRKTALEILEPDFLGRCYEFLLRKFAEGQGQSAGEFFTPTEVGFLIAEIMRPRPGEECYDYACGSCGLLIKLQLISRRLDPLSKVPLKLYG